MYDFKFVPVVFKKNSTKTTGKTKFVNILWTGFKYYNVKEI